MKLHPDTKYDVKTVQNSLTLCRLKPGGNVLAFFMICPIDTGFSCISKFHKSI